MPIQRRRRSRLFCPHGYHMWSWHHHMPPYGPPPGWGWGRPTSEEEKEYLDEYIEMLKEGTRGRRGIPEGTGRNRLAFPERLLRNQRSQQGVNEHAYHRT